jgi:hypothetical protein
MTANDPAFQTRPTAVAQITVLDRPGNISVVTHPAIPASNNVIHGHVIGACTHFESELVVTDLAAKANAMKPVGEDHRSHVFFFGISVQDNVTVFGLHGRKHQHTKHQDDLRRLHD